MGRKRDAPAVARHAAGPGAGPAAQGIGDRRIERDIRGRVVVFFPGEYENSNYRLLDARDGWNYLAVPITLQEDRGVYEV